MATEFDYEELVYRAGRWHEPWSWTVKRVEYDDGLCVDVKVKTGDSWTKRGARREMGRARRRLESEPSYHVDLWFDEVLDSY